MMRRRGTSWPCARSSEVNDLWCARRFEAVACDMHWNLANREVDRQRPRRLRMDPVRLSEAQCLFSRRANMNPCLRHWSPVFRSCPSRSHFKSYASGSKQDKERSRRTSPKTQSSLFSWHYPPTSTIQLQAPRSRARRASSLHARSARRGGCRRERRNVRSASSVNKGGNCLAGDGSGGLYHFQTTAGSSGYARGGVRDMEMGDQQNLPPLSDGRLGRFFLGERRDVAGAEDEYEMKLSCRLFGDVLDGIAMWP